VSRLRRALGGVSWYVKDLVGENDYDKYVAHLARTHPDRQPPSRREFERAKSDRREADPRSCCC
jgi:uncharacterized short protein YbdD (DUF466 family)